MKYIDFYSSKAFVAKHVDFILVEKGNIFHNNDKHMTNQHVS